MSTVTATPPAQPLAAPERGVVAPKVSWRVPGIVAALGVLALLAFGVGAPSAAHSRFDLSFRTDAVRLSPLVLPSQTTNIVIGVVCLLIAAFTVAQTARRRRTPMWLLAGFGVLWVFAFLVWAVAGKQTSLVDLLQGSLLLAVPLAFGAFGGVLCERSGVVNIAIEGQVAGGRLRGGGRRVGDAQRLRRPARGAGRRLPARAAARAVHGAVRGEPDHRRRGAQRAGRRPDEPSCSPRCSSRTRHG